MADGQLIFTHKIEDGAATRSFGIEVAKRAGLPPALLSRAEKLLQSALNAEKTDGSKQMGLFDAHHSGSVQHESIFDAPDHDASDRLEKISKIIQKVDPDLLSPREALNFIYDLQNELKVL